MPDGEVVAIFAPDPPLPEARWKRLFRIDGRQMVCERAVAPPAREPSALGPADVEAMLALAKRTEPGPFEPRTIEMGRYVGFKDEAGRLLAMGGERMHPVGYTEVSGICTVPEARGRGLAEAIVRAIAADPGAARDPVPERADRLAGRSDRRRALRAGRLPGAAALRARHRAGGRRPCSALRRKPWVCGRSSRIRMAW